MNRLVQIALSRPYTFIVLGILILIIGPLAILRTPVDIFPSINLPVISVVWTYNGLAPDDVSEIEKLEQLEVRRRDGVLLDVDLEPFTVLHEMRKTGLAHAAQRLHAPGDAHAQLRRKFLGRFGAVRRHNLGDRVGVVEPAAV